MLATLVMIATIGFVTGLRAGAASDRPATAPTTTMTATGTPPTPTTGGTATVRPARLVLPQPAAVPPDDGGSDPLLQIGLIEIPKIGVSSPTFEGIRLPTMDNGPGHWPGSAMPGSPGNAVFAGHRTSHNADFRRLDELVAGDLVSFVGPGGRRSDYTVASVEIVPADAMWIVTQTPARTATLFACHPPGSVSERIVAHLVAVPTRHPAGPVVAAV